MVDYQKCFIENLKYYRKLKGISQAQLAELCDVSNGTIGNIECGITKPSFDLIIQISAALSVEPENLFHSNESLPKSDNQYSDFFSKEQLKKIKTVLSSSIPDILKSLEQV